MNLTTTISCILLAVLNMISCEKEEDEPERFIVPTVISGHLYQNCDFEPYANLELYFYEVKQQGLGPSEVSYIGSTSTNENGFYSFDPGFCQSHKDLEVRDKDGRVVFKRGCNGDQGYIQYDKCSERTTQHYMKIFTDSSFTQNDTIYLGISGAIGPILTLPGPFKNGNIFLTPKVSMSGTASGYISVSINIKRYSDAYWGVGLQEYNSVKSRFENRQPPNYLRDIGQNVCGVGDTIVVDLRGY